MIRLFKHYIPHAVALLWLADMFLLLGANELSWRLRAGQIGMALGSLVDRIGLHAGFAVVISLSMVAVGVYGAEALRSMRFAAARLLVAISLGVIALSFVDFLFAAQNFWRSTLAYSMAFAIVLLTANRLVLGGFLGTSAFRRRVLVLGAGDRAQRLRDLAERPESGFVIVGYVAMSDGAPVVEEAISRGAIHNLTRFVDNLGVTEVVLALEERRNALPLKDLLRIKTTGVHVNEFSSFLERETGRVDLDTVNPSWLIFSDGFSSGRMISSVAKRLFDIVASAVALCVTAPIILLFALLVKIDSRGPAFYRQQRVGLFGENFDVIKLRSMRTDAEVAGAQWASKDDPRVTRVGRFIRKVRIDELPQAWTVLKGEMSFVGPRPERPQFVAELEDALRYYAERHMVKPGITGWAQINYPYGASIEDSRHKLEYDLYYAKNYTPFLDLLIILQTLRVVLWSEGAR
ncbi:sugar transferase (PEP-CTERM system associated)/exopolysaccharide biosynthesis polyprenyl glycosylphosphotransferase [Novosphingobium sp. PhB57]|jgi:sugar transferase (PEP-CTERM system associated)|uniref:TIGR03013 family XrtA/PEP-CTERM system glycosyltransferase n=1 Tax=unclassified Novosphingobium TaxID=2644732 RepID=UPI0010489C73|nr:MULTISPECIES: TIGR03013 family XrtA/PEP-CTERM system glycosyltransferase [unclassified Novosphingobium]TCU61281.1 sugar transferase (PEP-CTERM system associated)/exopolysaccharide biosynthesis polyprenyl glycosylphosphotransferase [Novosphingobium sp. PhB57]TDW68349.1 sugar transferase (PEP-CTERM system associated)/exopolysaccharide biosynthesis polyprenyl glycosylphosphotransferase [Novosphingobium sp. PhB55]